MTSDGRSVTLAELYREDPQAYARFMEDWYRRKTGLPLKPRSWIGWLLNG